jgi:hypothetical protein
MEAAEGDKRRGKRVRPAESCSSGEQERQEGRQQRQAREAHEEIRTSSLAVFFSRYPGSDPRTEKNKTSHVITDTKNITSKLEVSGIPKLRWLKRGKKIPIQIYPK